MNTSFDTSKSGDIDYIIKFGIAQNPAGVAEAAIRAYKINPALMATPTETAIQLKRRYNNGLPIFEAFEKVPIAPRNGAGKNFKGSDAAGTVGGGTDSPKPFGQTFVGGLLQSLIPGVGVLLGGGAGSQLPPAPAPDNDPDDKPFYQKPEGILSLIGLVMVIIVVAFLLFKGGEGKGA